MQIQGKLGSGPELQPCDPTQQTTATKITPTITWPTPAAISYGTAFSATQLDATANVGGTYTYKPALGAIENAGNDTLTLKFVPSDPTYTSTTASGTSQVDPDVTTTKITSASRDLIYLNKKGVAAATVGVNVTSYMPAGVVSFVASTGEARSGTIAPATGDGGCKIVFSTTGSRTVTAKYNGDNNHVPSTSSNSVTIVVNP